MAATRPARIQSRLATPLLVGLTNRRMRARMSGGVGGGRATRSPTRLPFAFGLPDSLAEDLKQAVGNFRMFLEERPEVPLRDGRQGHVAVSSDGCAPAGGVEERHLTEGVARAQLATLALHALHRHGAPPHYHEPYT